jgi:hypothetical protein
MPSKTTFCVTSSLQIAGVVSLAAALMKLILSLTKKTFSLISNTGDFCKRLRCLFVQAVNESLYMLHVNSHVQVNIQQFISCIVFSGFPIAVVPRHVCDSCVMGDLIIRTPWQILLEYKNSRVAFSGMYCIWGRV